MKDPNYSLKAERIIEHAETLHETFYKRFNEKIAFRGPSLYFHRKALLSARSHDLDKQLEYIYATLTSWGMHRMGKGGSKMVDFRVFRRSVIRLSQEISEVKRLRLENLHVGDDLRILEKIFHGIRVMETKTMLVGNSKVMAHLFPNLVPPIDRQYTLKYLRGHGRITNNPTKEWALMRDVIMKFFLPIAKSKMFQRRAMVWLSRQREYPWDTYIPKTIDNLVIGTRL
jgi:hypothetical protein